MTSVDRNVSGERPSHNARRAWAVALLSALVVGLTVGMVPGVIAGALVLVDQILLPGRSLLATSAVVALGLVPILWFVGSELPLSPPAVRVQDNVAAHHAAGLAIWLMFLTVAFEVRIVRKEPM